MPYTMRWLVDKRVVLTEFEGGITADDLREFVAELKQYISEGTPLVHHISNSHQIKKVEMSLGTLRSVAGAAAVIGQLGWQIDINTNPINKMFAGIGAQFAGIRSRTFATMDEAIEFLKGNDVTLQKLDWLMDDTGNVEKETLNP